MDVCLFSSTEGMVTLQGVDSSYKLTVLNTMRKRTYHKLVISIRVEIIRLVWVRGYRRVRLGRNERVKGHYRRY